jgi:CTP:molybdopterin cytidylyltransferase MocA
VRIRLGTVRTRVAGVLLAAGEGSRFGRPKALVELDGQTLAERGIHMLLAGGADPVLVVTGAAQIELAPKDPKTPKDPKASKDPQAPGHEIHTVYNGEWRTGMGSSLRAALRALSQAGKPDAAERSAAVLPPDVAAVVVALADQPLVGAEAVARLIAAHRAGASVAVAAYQGQPRNPVLLAREHWPEVIATATGDQGARAFLRARPDLVTLIECGDTGRPDDIDTTADLERIAGHRRGSEAVP